MTNELIEKNYNKWYNYSKIITSNNSASDLLQDFVLIILEKKLPKEKLTDNYVFISLRNMFLTRVKKTNKLPQVEINEDIQETLVIETNELNKEDIVFQKKLDTISKTIISLNQFERKLYQLHFIYGLSQRRIAREIGVSHLTINQRINKIKQKIKDNYEQ